MERLLELKQRGGTRISVVIPARNEERTVAGVVGPLRAALVTEAPLVDELVVIDSDSTDATVRAASDAGAVVYRARDIAPALGARQGKGEALWKSLSGDPGRCPGLCRCRSDPVGPAFRDWPARPAAR